MLQQRRQTQLPHTDVTAGGNADCSEGVGSGQMHYPPGYQPRRQLSNAEKGKTPVVQEDPIVEAIRRAIMGASPMIREGGQRSSGQASDQVAPRPPVLVRPKREFMEKHPAKMGLHPDEPISCDVMGFDDKMKRCYKLRKWNCHTHQYTVQLRLQVWGRVNGGIEGIRP